MAISCGIQREQRRLWSTRGKRGHANITGGSRKLPQLCMKRDPPPASLLRGSSNFILLVDSNSETSTQMSPLSPAITLLLRDLHV